MNNESNQIILNAAKLNNNEVTNKLFIALGYDIEDIETLQFLKDNSIEITDNEIIVDKNLKDVSKLTADQEYALVIEARNGSKEAECIITNKYYNLMCSLAAKYSPEDEYLAQDLVQEGWKGLHACIQSFDLAYGIRFVMYAKGAMTNKMLRYMYGNTPIRMPEKTRLIIERMIKYARSKIEFSQFDNFSWSKENIEKCAKELNLPNKKVEEYTLYIPMMTIGSTSFDDSKESGHNRESDYEGRSDENENYKAYNEDKSNQMLNPEEEVIRTEEMKIIYRIISTLPEDNQIILKNLYGFNKDRIRKTKEETAKMLGISKYFVSQKEAQSLQYLKYHLMNDYGICA